MGHYVNVVTTALAFLSATVETPCQSRYRILEIGQCSIVPDMNGDGYPELLIGSSRVRQSFNGRVRLYSGRDMKLLLELRGDAKYAYDDFGAAVATVGDLNGDKVRDLVVGIPSGGGWPGNVGEVRVFSGRDGKRIHTWTATATWEHSFGGTLSGVGDVDGDSVEDILVGSLASHSAVSAGAVHLYSGKSGKHIYRIDGLSAGAAFSGGIVAMGDLDGDRTPDFGVGARGDVLDPTVGNVGSYTVYSGRTGKALHKSHGNAMADDYGAGAARIGDVDADGVDDIVVGASEAGTFRAGYARVISGKTGKTLYQVAGGTGGDRFGTTVASLGDLDGDRMADFAVGAPQLGGFFPAGSGYVRVFSGRTGKVLFTLAAGTNEKYFGIAVFGPGDLDQDGVPDLVLAAGLPGRYGPVGHLLVYSTRDLSLLADTHALSLKQAGTQTLSLDAGTAHAGSSYWIFGSLTGTKVGIPLGGLRLPLDYDAYTAVTIRMPNSPVFPNSWGTLDNRGRATATFKVPASLPPLQGLGLHHAFLVFDRQGRPVFASNATLLRLQ